MSTWLSLRAPTHAPPPLQDGKTALHWAAASDSMSVKVLLAAGADVKATDKVGVGVGREG